MLLFQTDVGVSTHGYRRACVSQYLLNRLVGDAGIEHRGRRSVPHAVPGDPFHPSSFDQPVELPVDRTEWQRVTQRLVTGPHFPPVTDKHQAVVVKVGPIP